MEEWSEWMNWKRDVEAHQSTAAWNAMSIHIRAPTPLIPLICTYKTRKSAARQASDYFTSNFGSLICGKENLLEFEYFANFSFGLINEIIFSVLNWQDSMITNEKKKTTVQLLIVITEQHALFSGLLTLSVINAERYGSSFWDVFRFQCKKKNAHLQTKSFSHAFGV